MIKKTFKNWDNLLILCNNIKFYSIKKCVCIDKRPMIIFHIVKMIAFVFKR